MKSKKRYLQYILSLVCVIITVLIPQTVFAKDGTDGTELQVMEPEKLEVQLGVDWAGTEFQLKTDAGLYPGTITVDQDGVLRLDRRKQVLCSVMHEFFSKRSCSTT